jgi:hypothetical protein
MFFATRNILMNKVISHIHYIYIASPLLKKKLGYKLFTINFYFNSSQYYPTLDKTLAMQLPLHLICFIIRLYSCNINPHLVNLWFLVCILPRNMTVLWSVNITNGWNVHQNCFNKASHFFSIFIDLCQSFKSKLQFGTNTYITSIHS